MLSERPKILLEEKIKARFKYNKHLKKTKLRKI